MTSKEDLKEIRNEFLEIYQSWFENGNNAVIEKTKNVFESLEKDLEKLEQIKALVEKYNNDEIHFTRGFDFINIVREVLNNG